MFPPGIEARLEAGHADSSLISGSASLPIAGGVAVYMGPDSPFSQAVGLGMHGPVSSADLDRIETFFRDRRCAVNIDLSSCADPTLLNLIRERRYVVQEITHVLVRDVANVPGDCDVEPVTPGRLRAWNRMVIEGFMEDGPAPEELVEQMTRVRPGFHACFGLIEGRRAAAAAMEVFEGLCTLFGDATVRQFRGRGLQQMLIRHRLNEAARLGCELASASVIPGSISNRNYERLGFRLVYARVKFTLAL